MKYNKNYKRNYHPSDPGSAKTPQNVHEGLADMHLSRVMLDMDFKKHTENLTPRETSRIMIERIILSMSSYKKFF